MPWQNNSGAGGPWGGGGNAGSGGGAGGPGSGSGGGSGGDGPKSPWGPPPPERGKPPRPSRGNGPDFDEFIRRSQERLRGFGGGGSSGGRTGGGFNPPWALIAGGVAALWLIGTSFYRVNPGERAVVTRFGAYVDTTGPGVNFKLPSPIDEVTKLPFETVQTADIGGTGGENLMLTGDQNVLNIGYTVRWKIRNPARYLFEINDPDATIRDVAESAMRAEIARVKLTDAIGPQRAQIASQVQGRMQALLDQYRAGVQVQGVDINVSAPPQAVADAFNKVSVAQQNAQSYLNKAGQYRQQVVNRAQGDAAQFNAVYAQYKLAPEVTRRRLYLETMEGVLSKVDKTVVEPNSVQTYMPLPEVQRRSRGQAVASPAETAR